MKTDGEFVRQFIDAYEEERNLEGIFAEARAEARDQALEEALHAVLCRPMDVNPAEAIRALKDKEPA